MADQKFLAGGYRNQYGIGVYRDELADTEAQREALMEAYCTEFANPYNPAKQGHIDDIIEPKDTRSRLIDDLALLSGKRVETPPKDHGNIPE